MCVQANKKGLTFIKILAYYITAPVHINKYKTMLERVAGEKWSSLFGLISCDEEKKINSIETWCQQDGDPDHDEGQRSGQSLLPTIKHIVRIHLWAIL